MACIMVALIAQFLGLAPQKCTFHFTVVLCNMANFVYFSLQLLLSFMTMQYNIQFI